MSYPEDSAEETWKADGATFSIVKHDYFGGTYCGYVRFPKRPTIEESYKGILTYVPVHGGITYAEENKDGMVYGFDCNHAYDASNPSLKDMDWLKAECHRMAKCISIAAAHEEEYLAASDEGKADVIDAYHARLKEENIEFVFTDNFGAMINVLFGEL